MKNKRIGNDLSIVWSLLSGGQPFNIEGRDVTIYLKSAFGKTEIKDFNLSGNKVLWTFYGKDQKHTGIYSLELVINEGEKGMITTDKCKFVNLVACSCNVGGESEPNIEIETIEIASEIGYVYDDTEIKKEIEDLRNGKQDNISDLDEIRSGASKGSTALQSVPAEYVTDDELENALRNKVNKNEVATINGQSILDGGDITIEGGEGSYDDTELREAIERLEDEKANATDVENELTKKVDKVEGKGLSSNDYTTEEKNKLASLQNYDDSALRNDIAQKASTEGYYPKMEVGKADNLPDRVDVTEGAITFRESAGEGNSIEDGTAEIKELCGDTLVWNQLLRNNNFKTDLSGWTPQNSSVTHIQGGGVLITATSTTSRAIIQALKKPIPSNHTLLLSCTQKRSSSYNSAILFLFGGYQNYSKYDRFEIANVSSAEKRTDAIIVRTTQVEGALNFYPQQNGVIGDSTEVYSVIVLDLTQMFGAGNEPTSVEEFYARIPMGIDEYAYNEGEIVNVNINGIKSVNDNAWDEEWELGYFISSSGAPASSTVLIRCVNPIHILPNQQYHFSLVGTEAYAFFYDENMEYISYKNMNVGLFTTPSNAKWMRFYVGKSYGATYKNDICIRLAHSGYKTDYVPHEEDTMPLDLAKYFPNGMNGVNGVSDSLSMNEKVQRIGVVKMKDLNWVLTTSSGGYNLIYADFNSIKVAGACACTKYSSAKATSDFGTKLNEKSICVHIERSRFVIKDSSFSTSDSFKEQLTDNDYIYYELAEPIVEEIYPPLNLSYKVWDFGTEEILTDGASAPLITKAIYGFNATDTIRGNKAKIAQNTEEIVKLRNEIAQAIGNVINGDY